MVSPAAGADYRRGLGGTEHEVRSGVIFGELKWVAAEYMTNKTCSGGAIEYREGCNCAQRWGRDETERGQADWSCLPS